MNPSRLKEIFIETFPKSTYGPVEDATRFTLLRREDVFGSRVTKTEMAMLGVLALLTVAGTAPNLIAGPLSGKNPSPVTVEPRTSTTYNPGEVIRGTQR